MPAGSQVPWQLGQERGLSATANGGLGEPRAARTVLCQLSSQLLLSSKRNWGAAIAESADSGREGTTGTSTPTGKQQGLAAVIHHVREDGFHAAFVTAVSGWA